MGERHYLIFGAETDASGICEKFHKLVISGQNSARHLACALIWDAGLFHFQSIRSSLLAGRFFESPSVRMQGKKYFSRGSFFPPPCGSKKRRPISYPDQSGFRANRSNAPAFEPQHPRNDRSDGNAGHAKREPMG
jgi:hypothetical protein